MSILVSQSRLVLDSLFPTMLRFFERAAILPEPLLSEIKYAVSLEGPCFRGESSLWDSTVTYIRNVPRLFGRKFATKETKKFRRHIYRKEIILVATQLNPLDFIFTLDTYVSVIQQILI